MVGRRSPDPHSVTADGPGERTMRRCSLLLTAALIAAIPTMSASAADKDWVSCNQTQDWDRKVAGCTEVLKRGGRETVQRRAIALSNRGSAYHSKGEHHR